jgi:hypothetical protein
MLVVVTLISDCRQCRWLLAAHKRYPPLGILLLHELFRSLFSCPCIGFVAPDAVYVVSIVDVPRFLAEEVERHGGRRMRMRMTLGSVSVSIITVGRWISSPIMVVARTTAGGVFASALHAVQVSRASGIALGIPVAVCVCGGPFGRR